MDGVFSPAEEGEEWLTDEMLVEQGSCPGGEAGDEVVEVDPPTGSASPAEYAAMLKKKLDLYCAAVARSRGPNAKSQDVSIVSDNSQLPDASKYGSQASFNGNQPSAGPALYTMQKVNVGEKRANTSSELSGDDEDDLDGHIETMTNEDATDAKRTRRMLSNRESARRSRKRKQAHLNDLEAEVFQLRVENASLLKRLGDMTQKYNEACADNEVPRADAETMRAKGKKAEDRLRRSNGVSPMISTISDASTSGALFLSGQSDATSDAAVPVEADMGHFFP